jgi:hypothetical protein
MSESPKRSIPPDRGQGDGGAGGGDQRAGRRRGGRDNADVTDAFDVWLDRQLHQMFDRVAKEPIPEDLLRLIEGDRRKQQG